MKNLCFRVDAIRTAQEERDFKAANLKNPLDEELIKTKGQLKVPLRGDCKDSSKRESREIADAIAEIEEERQAKEDRIRKETSADHKKKESGEKVGKEEKSENSTESTESKDNFGIVDNDVENKNREQKDLNALKSQTTDGGDLDDDNASAIDKVTPDTYTVKQRTETENVEIKETVKTDRQRIENGQSGIMERVENEIKSNETLSYKDIEAEDYPNPGVTELDLIQNTGILVPDVKVDLDADDKDSLTVVPGASDCSAEFTFKSDFADGNSEIKKENVSSKVLKTKTSRREKVDEEESYRKRLSASISESDSDSKQEDIDSNEFNIQEIFGAKQLKHVERPPELGQCQSQTANGVDSSASGDEEEVYIAKSLPELAQVFEPGDLKPKRHSRRQDGSKSPKPGASEQKDSL